MAGKARIHPSCQALLNQGSPDTLGKRLANSFERVMDALRGPAPNASHLRDPHRASIAFVQERPVTLTQLADAFRQGSQALLGVVETKLLMRRDQHEVEFIAEIKSVAAARSEEIGNFEPGHAERPSRKAARRIILIKLFPNRQAGLLEEVVGIVEIAHEG